MNIGIYIKAEQVESLQKSFAKFHKNDNNEQTVYSLINFLLKNKYKFSNPKSLKNKDIIMCHDHSLLGAIILHSFERYLH